MNCNFKSKLIDNTDYCNLAKQICPGENNCILAKTNAELDKIQKQIKDIEKKII